MTPDSIKVIIDNVQVTLKPKQDWVCHSQEFTMKDGIEIYTSLFDLEIKRVKSTSRKLNDNVR